MNRVEAARVGDIVGIVKGQSHAVVARSDPLGVELKAGDDMKEVECAQSGGRRMTTPALGDILWLQASHAMRSMYAFPGYADTDGAGAQESKASKAGAEPNPRHNSRCGRFERPIAEPCLRAYHRARP